jgi:leucyl/phenylalanyl-tRNA--protein transferase
LTKALWFPPATRSTRDGVVAVGGDFQAERLLLAYSSGIFPWPMEGYPLLWFSPDPRFVLIPSRAHLHRSLRKRMRKSPYRITADTAFGRVIRACGQVERPGQGGTWVTPELVRGYEELFARGIAHSVEAWHEEELVGGLYGVSLGAVFFGESMFAIAPDASKVAFATLLGNLVHWGFALVDCQVHTEHLERFGAEEWPRPLFLQVLNDCLAAPNKLGPWKLALGPKEAEALLRTAGGGDEEGERG